MNYAINEWKGRFRRRIGGALITAVFIATAGYADEIALKGSVRLRDDDHVVRLGHIAELTGPFAERYADTVVADAPQGDDVLELSVRDIRRALDEAGVHWGKVQLNGRRVVVRPRYIGAESPPLAMTSTAIDNARRQDTHRPAVTDNAAVPYEHAAELVDRATLRGSIAVIVARGLGVDPNKLRLAFDRRDTEFLDTSQDEYRFEIQPLSSMHSDRIELQVRAWSAGRIQQRQSVTVRPSIQMDTVVLGHDLSRGTMFHEDDLAVESRWLPPSASARVATLVGAIGRVASGRLRGGSVLSKKDIAREFVIKRGDRVMVRCIVGGIVISLEAEARGNGAIGDRVELRKLGERDTFIATVTGPHAAVMDLNHL
ncbi:MAG: flagellar basal body P-ring formation chaperone FlgA [Phycisphaerales bacterium]